MTANGVPLSQLREDAIALRRAGKSRREIKEILQIRSNERLNDALRGEPPPPWTNRPNAKDDLRAKARQLRDQGLAYDQIAAELGVSKGSVSLWVRDLPRPTRLSAEECGRRRDEAVASYWAGERVRREASREAIRAAARQSIGALTTRDLLIAGAVAYWCEGAKSKPYRRSARLMFINSDPFIITLYLCFLRSAGVTDHQIVFRLCIHDSADVEQAQAFWVQVTGAEPARFRRPTLKHHNPKTIRLNTNEGYHGCLRIDVLGSAALYLRIEGWCEAIMNGAVTAAAVGGSS
jgi:transcriptional regulator with XRE-family HTH domain